MLTVRCIDRTLTDTTSTADEMTSKSTIDVSTPAVLSSDPHVNTTTAEHVSNASSQDSAEFKVDKPSGEDTTTAASNEQGATETSDEETHSKQLAEDSGNDPRDEPSTTITAQGDDDETEYGTGCSFIAISFY